MRARSNPSGAHGPGLRALYPVPVLATASGVTPPTMARLLRRQGVQFVHVGRAVLVPLCEIQRCMPSLWDSLLAAEQLRAEAAAIVAAAPR